MTCLTIALLVMGAGGCSETDEPDAGATDTATATDTDTATATDTATETDTEPEPEPDTESDTATETDTGPDSDTTSAHADSMDVGSTPSPTDSDSDTDTDTDTDTATDTDAGTPLPVCTTPTGAPGIAFGPAGGVTVHISNTPMNAGKTYTRGLAALAKDGLWVAEHGGVFYRSTDAGCTWQSLGNAPSAAMRIQAGKDDQAWAWYDNGKALARIVGATVEVVSAPISSVIGLGTDRVGGSVRIADTLGQQWESADGKLWKKVGGPAAKSGSGYRVAYAPMQVDTALYGAIGSGFVRTTDGGKTWVPSVFQGAAQPAKINGMNAVFSATDEAVVWAMAIDITEGLQTPSKTNGKYIWRSVDGGKTFTKAVAHLSAPGVTITNGVHLVPDSADKGVVRWAHGTCFSGVGTNLYRYDANAVGPKLSWNHHNLAGIDDIVTHPADPSLLVLGLRGDNGAICP